MLSLLSLGKLKSSFGRKKREKKTIREFCQEERIIGLMIREKLIK